jgi:hypothetical protein
MYAKDMQLVLLQHPPPRPPAPCTDMVVPIIGVISENVGWVDGKD